MFKFLAKILAVSLSVALVTPLLAGCSAQKAPPIKNLVNVLASGADKSGRSDAVEAIEVAVEKALEGGILYFPKGRYKIARDVAIPLKASVFIAEGAVFDISEDAELSIKSLVFEAPNEKIFTGAGLVKNMSSYVSVRPEWFGARADDNKDDSEAIKKAIYAAGGSIYLSEGTYNIDIPVNFEELGAGGGSAIAIRGIQKGKTVIKVKDGITAFKNEHEGVGVSSYFFEDLNFEGNGTGEAIYLMHQAYIANCSFKNLKRAFYANKAGMSSFLYNTAENITESVFEIGDDTMFIYFYGNHAERCGTLVKVRGGGARCTGIQITNCSTKDMTGYDIDLYAAGGDTNFVDGCRFEGGTGKAFIKIAQVLHTHVSENEIIGANNGKSGIVFEGDSHSAVVNQNLISGVKNGIEIAGSSYGSVSENFLKNNETDIALYSALGYSVHSNWLHSDNPITMAGGNHKTVISENLYKKEGAAHLADYEDEFITSANNVLSSNEPSRDRILTGEKSIDTDFIPRTEISAHLPRTDKNTASVVDFMNDGGSFAEALTAAASSLSNGGTVIVEGVYTLDKDVTLPENITLAVIPNSKITVANGKTLTVASSEVQYLSPTEIFEGEVKLPNADYVLPEWFGALNGSVQKDSGDAIEKAILTGAKTVRLARGKYLVSNPVDIPSGVDVAVLGEGHNVTFVNASGGITIFSAERVTDNDSFSIAALSADGNGKAAGFITFAAEKQDTKGYLKAGDFFGNNFKFLIKTENISGKVEITDFYIGSVKDGYILNATDNVYGLRSLTVGMDAHTVYIDGKKPDGTSAKNHVYVNFCSVMSQKNLVMKNVEDVLYSAAGYDSAVGKFEATLTFENIKDGIFETTYITSANKHGVIIKDCENFTLLGNEIHSLLDAVVVENSKNVILQDNWYYNTKGISNQLINNEGVTLIGSPVVTLGGENNLFISNEGSRDISFVASIYDPEINAIDVTDPEMTLKGNFDKKITLKGYTVPEKIGFTDFKALISTQNGATVADSRQGVIYKDNGAAVIDNFTGSWFGNAGITSVNKMAVSGLDTKLEIIRDVYAEPSISRCFTLELSEESPEKITGGATDSKNSLALTFWFTENGVSMRIKTKGTARRADYEKKDIVIFAGEAQPESLEMNVSFTTEGKDIIIDVNGIKTVVGNGTSYLAKEVYLSYVTQCYGAASLDLEVKSLNGEAIK